MSLRSRKFRISRDTILFVVGLLGIAYVTLIDKVERPTLLILFAAMVGLPAFLRTDERYQQQQQPPTSAAPKQAEVEPPPGGETK